MRRRTTTRRARLSPWLAIGVVICVVSSPDTARAVPVFARLYGESCLTCHVMVPKLNATGEVFRANGYRFPGESRDQRREEPVPLGPAVNRRLWPQRAVWPGELPGNVPLAFRVEMDLRVQPEADVRSDFRMPHELEILSGGRFGESLSFFVEFHAIKDGAPDVLPRAFLQFHRVVGTPLVNVKVGQFEPRVVAFSRFRNLTMESFITSGAQSGPSGFRFKDAQRGVELWGHSSHERGGGLLWAAGVVNGNGEGTVTDGGGLDENSSKDTYGRLALKVGGVSPSGENGAPAGGASWVDNSLVVGVMAYRGLPSTGGFWRYGADARIRHGRLDLFGAAITGSDDVDGDDPEFVSWFGELDAVIMPWLVAVGRYGRTDGTGAGAAADAAQGVLALNAAVRPNVLLRLETVRWFEGPGKDSGRIRVEFVY